MTKYEKLRIALGIAQLVMAAIVVAYKFGSI
jgi:hypothetical protein